MASEHETAEDFEEALKKAPDADERDVHDAPTASDSPADVEPDAAES